MPEGGNGQRRHRRISRRDMLRRGAVVGGTLLWTVPIIQSVTRAHQVGSPVFFCCHCRKPRKQPQSARGRCIRPAPTNPDDCARACHEAGFTSPEFHSGPSPIPCNNRTGCGAH